VRRLGCRSPAISSCGNGTRLNEENPPTMPQELKIRRLTKELSKSREEVILLRVQADALLASEGEARFRALHDDLTGLPNRHHFRLRLENEMEKGRIDGRPSTLLCLDLDGFKTLNDTYGHDAGDQVLQIVAGRMMQSIRRQDMASRVGGDEFACVLSGMSNREDIRAVALALLAAVAEPMWLGDTVLNNRLSIGIAIMKNDEMALDAWIKRADSAMYRAKRGRIGHAFF
jgi:diguanylate cyclase (GGDEF)-like protein